MTQEEFTKLSENKVQELNGLQDNQDVTSSWRDGYIYLQTIIRNGINNLDNSEFIDKMIDLAYDDIDTFN